MYNTMTVYLDWAAVAEEVVELAGCRAKRGFASGSSGSLEDKSAERSVAGFAGRLAG